MEEDSDSAIQGFYDLLGDANIDNAVRKGDIYASIVEYYAENKNFKSALGTLQEMKNNLPKVVWILILKFFRANILMTFNEQIFFFLISNVEAMKNSLFFRMFFFHGLWFSFCEVFLSLFFCNKKYILLISQLIKGSKEKIFIKPNFRQKYQTSSSGQKFFGKKMQLN